MYCTSCGSKNAEGSVFCSSCGKPLFTADNSKTEKSNKRGRGAVIGVSAVAGFLAVFLISLTVFYFLGKNNEDPDTETKGHSTIEVYTASGGKTDSSSSGSNSSSGKNNGSSGSSSSGSNQGSKKPSQESVPAETLTGSAKPSGSSSSGSSSSGSSSSGSSSSGALYMGSASYVDWLSQAEAPPARYYSLCFAGNYAFYIDTDDQGLYRVNLDGTGHTRIHDIGDYPGDLRAYNDEIYYVGYANGFSQGMPADARDYSTYGLHWVNKNGRASRIVETDILNSYRFHNNLLIFPDGNTICCSDVSGTEDYGSNEVYMSVRGPFDVASVELMTKYGAVLSVNNGGDNMLIDYNMYSEDYAVLHNDGGYNLTVYDNKYFFISGGKLYSVNSDGSSKKTIANGVDDYVQSGDYIFYTDSSKKDLYRMKRDGTDKKMIVQYMYCKELAVKSNKIYFSSIKEDGYIYSVTTDGRSIKLEFGSNAGAKDISDFLESGIEYFI